jgi:hypothetical protein
MAILASPAKGIVLHQAATITPAATPNKLAYGKTVVFSYPARFESAPSPHPVGNVIESFSFSKAQLPIWEIAVQVLDNSSGQLESVSGYQFRKLHPELYSEATRVIANRTVIIMADQGGGWHKVAFLLYQDKAATIAVSSASSIDSDQLEVTLNTLLSNWRWL